MAKIHQVARDGDLAELLRLLDDGADLETRDDKTGHTPLIAACLSPNTDPEIVQLLLDRGANVHASGKRYGNQDEPLIALAIQNEDTNCDKIRLLIVCGAEVHYRSAHGYTLLTLASCGGREDVIDLLLAAGAPVDGKSDHGESALSVLSRRGLFDAVAKILGHGADPGPLQWTTLHRAVALGSLGEVGELLDQGGNMETTDFWERTALLLAIQAGDTEKAGLLLSRGANRKATGRCGKPPMHYPIDRDDAAMLQWLIGQGFDIGQEDRSGNPALVEAVTNSAPACFRALIAAGADWKWQCHYGFGLMHDATHPEIIRTLMELGADAAELEAEQRRKLVGLDTTEELSVSKEEYFAGRFRRFGNANPERMRIPYWDAMVRCGWEAYQAAGRFGDESFERNNPVWCHHRLGMSLTVLPDGRFVEIAGEHEDHYDPDFCIYNEVFVHDGKGGFEIFGYPDEVFPPTDFHSATLVGPWIYIIGSLGYRHTQNAQHFQTPVYRLHTETWRIERVSTRGKSPGWIYSHRAQITDACILVSGGKVLTLEAAGDTRISDHTGRYSLDLETHEWRQLADSDP
ncbi:MAG: ankyrin repeat domain-containing protein [Akkermansiaceae bacterium]|jgi:ankyrin repeat protein|nr:ankyrin repeat domain-containing protein [Akkermansiaceae bacterium]